MDLLMLSAVIAKLVLVAGEEIVDVDEEIACCI